MNDLKTVRDALSSAIKRLETIKETFPAISVDSDIKIYRDGILMIDRMIETPAPTEKVDLDLLGNEIMDFLVEKKLLQADGYRNGTVAAILSYLFNTGRLR